MRLKPCPPTTLLAQADVLLVLARLLARPDVATVAAAGGAEEDLVQVATLGGFSAATRDLLIALCRAAATAEPIAWQAEYHRLFGPTAICPVHEAGWIKRDRGPLLGDIAAFAHAFGFRLDESCHDRYDHLAAECELLAMLFVMEARAREAEHVEHAEITARAIASFVDDHPGVWMPGFCAALIHSENHPVYAALGPALARVWDDLCACHGWTVQPLIAPRGAIDPDDPGPYGCGGVADAQHAAS